MHAGVLLHRQCACGKPASAGAECAECRRQKADTHSRADPDTGWGTLPGSVERALAGSGSPLEISVRQEMEQAFGHDFSRVRVHSEGAAEQSARDVAANAYTVGHDIVFAAGHYAPRTPTGRRLIAHELTHVVQNDGVRGARAGAQTGVLMRQPAEQGQKAAPSVDADPCTDPD